jgi:hypothetical protein
MNHPLLAEARACLEADPDKAHALCVEMLRQDPDYPQALFLAGVIQLRAERQGTAIPLLEKCARLRPEKIEVWQHLGMAWQECQQPLKARECFQHAHKIKPTAFTLGNIGVTYMDEGDTEQAIKLVKKALEMDPSFVGARATLGFAQLSRGNWDEGWKNYEACLGGRFRKELDFGAPRWDGSPVDTLIIYGEQGLGDEIMYASCIADAQKLAKHVTLECDERLEGLFRRSFPDIEVHGTRRNAQPWLEGRSFDAQCAIGSLPSLFRPSPDSCPKTPYLTADPERRVMWRALFDSWKKPVVGICWSGGKPASQKFKRAMGLESMRELIETRDAVFVSLQYNDPTAEIEASGLPVRVMGAALSPDYDDMAAMVAELDHIVGIHTTAHHLAGALGKASTVLVPQRPMWMYAYGSRAPWYAENVYWKRQDGESWAECVARLNRSDVVKLGTQWKEAA